jgi:hypothetical protein
MDVIEESIFRKPGGEGAEPFDLEAYRELVMLYNLGREVVHPEEQDSSVSGGPRSMFNETSMQPLSVSRHSSAPSFDQDSMQHSELDSMMDSSPGQTGLGDMVDLDSMLLEDSDLDGTGPHTTGHEFHDPQVPRPSPRLGLDIDLTAPAEPQRKPPADGNSIDFDLFEPERDTDTPPDKPK